MTISSCWAAGKWSLTTQPAPRLALDRHPPSMQFGDALDDGQTEADALAGGTGGVGPVEPIEEARQMLGAIPRPVSETETTRPSGPGDAETATRPPLGV